MDAENPNASSPSAAHAPQEGGYGSPSPEEEMPQGASTGGTTTGGAASQRSAQDDQGKHTADTEGQDRGGTASREQPQGDLAEPEEAPSTDADLDEGNTEDHGHRESFSSESDDDGSGLPEGGTSA